MRYRTSFTVAATPEAAFDYLANGRNGLWGHPTGTTMEQIPPGPVGLGTEFIFHRPSGPAFKSMIAAYERPVRLAFLGGDEGESPVEAVWTFSPGGRGARLTVDTESSFVGPRWMQPFATLLTLAAWPLLLLKMRGLKRRISREVGR